MSLIPELSLFKMFKTRTFSLQQNSSNYHFGNQLTENNSKTANQSRLKVTKNGNLRSFG